MARLFKFDCGNVIVSHLQGTQQFHLEVQYKDELLTLALPTREMRRISATLDAINSYVTDIDDAKLNGMAVKTVKRWNCGKTQLSVWVNESEGRKFMTIQFSINDGKSWDHLSVYPSELPDLMTAIDMIADAANVRVGQLQEIEVE